MGPGHDSAQQSLLLVAVKAVLNSKLETILVETVTVASYFVKRCNINVASDLVKQRNVNVASYLVKHCNVNVASYLVKQYNITVVIYFVKHSNVTCKLLGETVQRNFASYLVKLQLQAL